ncbi:arylsulfatase [Pontibacter sp. E15-1]|uniref:sulfatase family protein n=1 Tax=Pontibacter sp. E15-1 TaxID=2919918 RepID=UPI001F5003A6|nr:arylsulfatase [Pontibacter sp. E15-1]MCJ8163286.1 arylsulfatase [Pontibacter sp. E15-1]
MKKISLALLLLLHTGLSCLGQQPNVVVILADDIGTGDISFYQRLHPGNVMVETPNIDRLAQHGMYFTNAHAPAALCAPSRYAIMTGNNTYRSYQPWGVWGAYERSPIEPGQLTLGKLMQQAGYHTAFLGKWHMGGDWNRKSDTTRIYRSPRKAPEMDVDITKRVGGGPLQNGFDYALTLPSGVQDVPYAVYEHGKWTPLKPGAEIGLITQENMRKIGVDLDKDEGLGDLAWDPHTMGPLLAQKAVSYIEEQSRKKQPFFMYYSSQAVHLPHTPPATLNGRKIAGSTPEKHLDMIVELDEQVGMIVDALKATGKYENTLIIFTSDNGGLMFPTTLATGHQPNSIYRSGKNSIYEGGHRVPFIASWPGKIKEGRASDELVVGLDIMATLAGINKQGIPQGQALDSHNLLPLLLGKQGAHGHAYLLLQGGTGHEASYHEGDWKLIVQLDPADKTDQTRTPIALFDLRKNPSEIEQSNLLNTLPEKAQELFNKYNKRRDMEGRTASLR